MSVKIKEQARELAYKEWWDFEAREYLVDVFKNDHEFADKCLLRYLFVKIIDRTNVDDPVFIFKPTVNATKMIEEDLRYMKITKPTVSQVVFTLDKYLAKALDRATKLSQLHLGLKFDGEVMSDAERRYVYLGLNKSTLALGVDYKAIGYEGNEEGIVEAFASSIQKNHTFTKWCSAFPDVDQESMGSFWNLEVDNKVQLIMCNPPFDVTLMNCMFQKIESMYTQQQKITFFIVVPDWKGWKELDSFCSLKDCFTIRKKTKEMMKFQNVEGELIGACNTLWIYYGCKRELDEKGKILI